jgi:hypothetical protein
VGQGCVDPGHGEDGQECINDRYNKQVPVIRSTLLQPDKTKIQVSSTLYLLSNIYPVSTENSGVGSFLLKSLILQKHFIAHFSFDHRHMY